ncbi:dTDP-4-dehydrorhamnose reductase [Streptomyces sp. YJ-C3]
MSAVLPPGRTTALTRQGLDITDFEAVADTVGRLCPDIVVNCAAWTDVDAAENHEAAATEVNATAVRNLARVCARTGARLLHISTDYVFSGAGPGGEPRRTPYPENADPRPLTAYGRSKRAGERAVLDVLPDAATVIRTGWLYGRHGRSFVRTVLDRARSAEESHVVNDQYGQPTWSKSLAGRLKILGEATSRPGVLHLTSTGHATWYELAQEIYRWAGADAALVSPISTADLGRPAPRPAWSVLAHDRASAAGLGVHHHWRDELRRALPHLVDGLKGRTPQRNRDEETHGHR